MSFFEADGFIEFTHCYDDGDKVVMRGLYAAPFVVTKYRIAPDEVVAFTSWHGGQKAVTVFHFHPDYKREEMRGYMEAHADGKNLLEEVRAERQGLSGLEWFETVQASGVWGEVAKAAVGAGLKTVKNAVLQMAGWARAQLRPEPAVEVEVSARALSLTPPPKPAIATAKFPVVWFPKEPPKKVEGISDELAVLSARNAMAQMGSRASHTIH